MNVDFHIDKQIEFLQLIKKHGVENVRWRSKQIVPSPADSFSSWQFADHSQPVWSSDRDYEVEYCRKIEIVASKRVVPRVVDEISPMLNLDHNQLCIIIKGKAVSMFYGSKEEAAIAFNCLVYGNEKGE